uniref:Uncharacterized protein n=1 Tax=Haptolina ericina TaxID=156174 RepID=A0A7S3BNC8_9EUKA
MPAGSREKGSLPAGSEYRRRIVVQLPPEGLPGGASSSAKKGAKKSASTDEEMPVVFGCEDPAGLSVNGWATYTRVQGGGLVANARAQAVVTPSLSRRRLLAEEKAKAKAKGAAGGKVEKEMATKWMERLMGETEQLVEVALGSVNEVITIMVQGAWRKDDLHSLPSAKGLETAEQAPKDRLLLRELASPTDARVQLLYSKLLTNIHETAARAARLGESLFQENHVDEKARPPSFFQVSIDLPGFGASADEIPIPQGITVPFIAEICMALGKQHAYGIIAHGTTCGALLICALERQSISSYLVLRDPDGVREGVPIHRVQHPTLVLSDSEKANAKIKATIKKLAYELQQLTVPKLKFDGASASKEMANAFVDMCRASSWMGAVSTDGTDSSAPLLTRLTGGVNAWKGTRVEYVEPMHSKIKRYWSRVRSAVRLGTFTEGGILAKIKSQIQKEENAEENAEEAEENGEGEGEGDVPSSQSSVPPVSFAPSDALQTPGINEPVQPFQLPEGNSNVKFHF